MKHKIDRYFIKEYDNLLKLATARVLQYQRGYDPAVLVSNCYLYLIKKQNQIPTVEDIEIWARKFISSQVYWSQSETNKEELEIHRNKVSLTYQDEEEDDDIDYKILLEEWYNNRKAVLELYRKKLRKEDRIKLILLDKILIEETTSSRKIAGHYNIPHHTVWIWFREIKRDLKKFEKELNRYDKTNNIRK